MERWKAKTVAAKRQTDRGDINSFNKDDDNYYSDTNNMNPN